MNTPQDIGIEGLKVKTVALKNHIYDFYVEHSDMVLEQGMSLDMIDVTTMDDTERKFIMGFTGNPGTR